MTEFLVLKVRAHSIDKPLPKLLALFVDRPVADDGEFVRARGDKNEDSVAPVRFMHAEPVKFLLRRKQRIGVQFSALNKNADLTGRFRFRLSDRLHDSIVLEFAEKFLGSHFTNSNRRRPRQNLRRLR